MVEEVSSGDRKADGDPGAYLTLAAVASPLSDISIETKPSILLAGRTSGPARRSTKGGWTDDEDEHLCNAVKLYNAKNWKKIAESFPGRNDVQCLHRWQKVLNPELIKGPWTKEEDDLIIELVKKHGLKKWSIIAESLKGRIGKQCRERWHNHLNPEIKKDAWTTEEDAILIRAHQTYGNKWAEMAKLLPGRADNSIKNHWNCSVKKKLDSKFSSRLPSYRTEVGAVVFDNHATESKCPIGNPEKESINLTMPSNPKRSLNAHLMASKFHLVNQSERPERLNLDLRLYSPGVSKCSPVRNQLMPVEDFNRKREEIKAVPKEDSKCTTSESCYGKTFVGRTYRSPGISQENGLGSSDLTTQCLSKKLKDASFSSYPACDLSAGDRVQDDSQVLTTPLFSSSGDSGPCDAQFQLIGKEGSVSNRYISTSESCIQKSHNPVHCSSSSDLLSLHCIPSSPLTILRSLGKSFETPSIIRKRVRQSSEPLSVENFHREMSNVKDSAGDSGFFVRAKSIKYVSDSAHSNRHGSDGQVDCNRINNLSAGQFFRLSVARRLEDEFQMQQVDPLREVR